MKWALYAAAAIASLLVIAIFVLLALGGARGQARHVVTMEIGRPAAEVYRWVREPALVEQWVGWLIEIRPLTPQPSGPGSVQLWVMEDRNNDNARMELRVETLREEPDRLLEARVTAPGMVTGTVLYELQPMDPRRTLLSYRATYQYEHWLARLLTAIVSRSAQQKLEADLARLKAAVEAA